MYAVSTFLRVSAKAHIYNVYKRVPIGYIRNRAVSRVWEGSNVNRGKKSENNTLMSPLHSASKRLLPIKTFLVSAREDNRTIKRWLCSSETSHPYIYWHDGCLLNEKQRCAYNIELGLVKNEKSTYVIRAVENSFISSFIRNWFVI